MNLALRLALRELRGGLGALRLLAVCLALGVMAIAAVGSLSSAIIASVRDQGQTILGGDLEVRLPFRQPTPAEGAAMERAGVVSHVSRMRAMAGAGDKRSLVELKAVDRAYPLYGSAALAGGGSLPAALGHGVVLAADLADSLGVRMGDTVSVGRASFPVAGILAEEPDRAGAGFALGPTLMLPRERLAATGLIQPGSIVTEAYRIRIAPGADARAAAERLKAAVPGSDWEIRTRDNAAPGLTRFIASLGTFLTLVALAALAVAGVGVGQGVQAYLQGKLRTIATLKTLGAGTRLIATSYLIQIALVAAGACLVGAALGALAPWLALKALAGLLPVAPRPGFYVLPLLLACAYGLLVAAAFALWPLGRAALASPARLLRSEVDDAPARPSPGAAIGAVLAGALCVALAVAASGAPELAAGFIGGVLGLIALLAAAAYALRWAARRAPQPTGPLARLALGSLTRPRSPAPQLVVALGLGLSIFAALAVIESSLSAEIRRALPANAPDLVVFDAPKESIKAIRAAVDGQARGSHINAAPSLRGPVTAVRGVPVSQLRNIPPGTWVLQGDRGLTYSDAPPEGNEVVAGRWWSKGYQGPPLVSMDADQAKNLGLRIGDTITVAVLGADIEAKIANLRSLDFRRATLQYMFVYNEAALKDAPFSWVVTVSLSDKAREAAVRRALARAVPTASVIGVRETVTRVNGVLNQVLLAVRAAAGAAIAAGLAVLVGALAAQARRRAYEATLLKVLGGTRGQVLRAGAIEYGALGLSVALIALALGTGAGALILRRVLDLPFAPAWGQVALTVTGGAALVLCAGLFASWRTLGARPAAILRSL